MYISDARLEVVENLLGLDAFLLGSLLAISAAGQLVSSSCQTLVRLGRPAPLGSQSVFQSCQLVTSLVQTRHQLLQCQSACSRFPILPSL